LTERSFRLQYRGGNDSTREQRVFVVLAQRVQSILRKLYRE